MTKLLHVLRIVNTHTCSPQPDTVDHHVPSWYILACTPPGPPGIFFRLISRLFLSLLPNLDCPLRKVHTSYRLSIGLGTVNPVILNCYSSYHLILMTVQACRYIRYCVLSTIISMPITRLYHFLSARRISTIQHVSRNHTLAYR